MRRAIMLLAYVVLGCSSSESAPTPAPAGPAASPAGAAPAVASAEVASPEIAEIDDAVDRRGAKPESSELVLHAVARGYSPLRLFRTSDDVVFVAAGVHAIRIPPRGPLVREPKFLAGIADPGRLDRASWQTTAITGRLLDGLYMMVESASARGGVRRGVYRFAGDAWQPVLDAKVPIEAMSGDAPWRTPSDLGVVEPSRLVVVGPDDMWLHHGAGVLHFDGTTWAKIELPYAGAVPSLAVSAELGLWIVIGADNPATADDNALFRRVDDAWTEIEMPSLQFPVAPQPSLVFGLDDDEMAAEAIDPSWQHDLAPMQVLAQKNDLWVTTRGPAVRRGGRELGTHRWALLHNRYRGAPLELPDAETMRRELLDLGPDRPFTGRESCAVFVPIAVDRVRSDHDELRAELDEIGTVQGGMLLVEVVRDGSPAIGVVIPGGRPRKAKALVAALRRSLGPRMAAPICQPMIATRVLERWSGG